MNDDASYEFARPLFREAIWHESFARDGFLKVDFCEPSTIADVVERVRALRPSDAFSPKFGEGDTAVPTYHCTFLDLDVDYKRGVQAIISEFFVPRLAELLVDFELLTANLYVKQPGSGRFEIHQNWPVSRDPDVTTLTAWIPLHDVDARNGTIHLVPGSHKIVPDVANPVSPPFFAPFEDELVAEYLVPVPLRTGEALIFCDSLIHWSPANQSEAPRVAVQIELVPRELEPVLFHLDPSAPESDFETYAVDSEFFSTSSIGNVFARPAELPYLGRTPNRNRLLTKAEFREAMERGPARRRAIYASQRMPSASTPGGPARAAGSAVPVRVAGRDVVAHAASDVERYYDELTDVYVAGFGEVFQGSRPESTDELLAYIADAADLREGARVLDAGCGVGGPATWFAANRGVTVDAVTISEVQRSLATKRILERGLSDRVRVHRVDFHHLARAFPDERFDRILFLESICHAEDYRRVLRQAKSLLERDGLVYVKDFYCVDHRSRPHLLEQQRADLVALNDVYRLAMPDLPSLVDLVCELGFRIDLLRHPTFESTLTHWEAFERLAGRAWGQTSPLWAIQPVELVLRRID